MKNKLPSLSEHQIQQQCIHYLQTKAYYVMRLNAGQYEVGQGKSRRFVMGVQAGTPDIMAFHINDYKGCLDLYFFEIKVPGKKPTLVQARKMQELEEYGAKCMVIHSLEQLQEKI